MRTVLKTLVKLSLVTVISCLKCVSEGDPGMTVPRGDIGVHIDSDFTIDCIIDLNHEKVKKNNYTINDVEFRYVLSGGLVSVPSEVYNSTTRRLTVSGAQEDHSGIYLCKFVPETTAICMNTVEVGHEPLPLLDFTCRSHNWERLVCRWRQQHNGIATDYTVTYGGKNDTPPGQRIPCKLNRNDESCEWTDNYLSAREYLYFFISGRNILQPEGVEFETIPVNNFKIVVPDPPNVFRVSHILVDEAKVEWELGYPWELFHPGLVHSLSYYNEWDHEQVMVNLSHILPNDDYPTVLLTNLPYPDTIYNISLQWRSAEQEIEEEYLWSKPTYRIFKTKATAPYVSPNVDVGSFELQRSRTSIDYSDVYIFWEQLKVFQQNGPGFKYKVSVHVDSGFLPIEPTEMNHAYFKFSNLSNYVSYRFFVNAVNSVGSSADSSMVSVNTQAKLLPEKPRYPTVTFLNNGSTEMSWYKADSDVDNYTVFWCLDERPRPYRCDGMLQWKHVSGDSTSLLLNLPEVPGLVYHFAVSANARLASSGLYWATCSVVQNEVSSQLNTVVVVRSTDTSATLSWQLECSNRVGHVKGYQVRYCVTHDVDSHCSQPEVNETYNCQDQNCVITVENMSPYTLYRMTVSITTSAGTSLPSEPVYVQTGQGAPSSPEVTRVWNVTSSSVSLGWSVPTQPNGVIQRYIVAITNINEQVVVEMTEAKVINLKPYIKYGFRVAACTEADKCSPFSSARFVTTRMSAPGMVSAPSVRFENNSRIVVSWDRPDYPNGPISYYTVHVESVMSGDVESVQFINTTENMAVMNVPQCDPNSAEQEYRVVVAAVNVDENYQLLIGANSPVVSKNCQGLSVAIIAVISCVTAAIMIVLLVILCVCRRAKKKVDEVREFKVELPPRIEIGDSRALSREDFLSGRNGTKTVLTYRTASDEDRPRHDSGHSSSQSVNSADELIGRGRQTSGESNGTHSGKSSAASALTCRTNVSTDSGTEADTSLNDNDDKKQQNGYVQVGSNGYVPTTDSNKHSPPIHFKLGTVKEDDSNANMNSGYSKVGLDNGWYGKKPTMNGYITTEQFMGMPNKKTSGYITDEAFSQQPSEGYSQVGLGQVPVGSASPLPDNYTDKYTYNDYNIHSRSKQPTQKVTHV